MNIDAAVLGEPKRRQRREGKSLAELMSELLATALKAPLGPQQPSGGFDWLSRPRRGGGDACSGRGRG